MHSNNKVIKKLIAIGKKHKFMTYPMLVLIAIVSMCLNLKTWARGSGKRTVALMLACALVISQSYFMTSSANQADFVVEEEEEEEGEVELGPLNSSVDDTDSESEEETTVTEATLVSTEAPDVTEAEVVEDTTPAETIDVPDAEDLREDVSPLEPVEEDTDVVVKDISSDDEEDEDEVESETFEGAGDSNVNYYKNVHWDSSELEATYKTHSFNGLLYIIMPNSYTRNDVANLLPKDLKADEYTSDNLKLGSTTVPVKWRCANSGSTGHGGVEYYIPYWDSQRKADPAGIDIDENAYIHIRFLSQFSVEIDANGGEVTMPSSGKFEGSAGSYFGYLDFTAIHSTYKLPSVSKDHFTVAGWDVYYDGVFQEILPEGANFSVAADSTVSKVKFVANYNEVEVKYLDEKNDTVYKYPLKTSPYSIDYRPTPIQGYVFMGWTLGEAAKLYQEGDLVTNSPTDMEFTAHWEARSYKVKYYENYDGGGSTEKVHTYGVAGDTYDTFASLGWSRTGYSFDGWAKTPTGDASIEDGAVIDQDSVKSGFATETSDPPVVELYATWKECAITFEDGTTAAEFSAATVYGDAFNESFKLKGDNSSGNYLVKSYTVMNGTTDASPYFASLSVSGSSDKLVIAGTPIATWDGDVIITAEVYDSAVPDKTYNLTVSLTTSKKKLEISNVSSLNKLYDGTKTLADGAMDSLVITLDGIYSDDDVTVDKTTLSVSYDDKEAGTRDVILENIALAGAKKAFYEIDASKTLEGAATIGKRPLFIKVDGTVKQYLGEDKITQDSFDFPPSIDKEAFEDDAEADKVEAMVSLDGGLKNVVTLTYQIPPVQQGETYDVPVTALADNYAVSCKNANVKLQVLQEKAIPYTGANPEEENFTIETTDGNDGWSTEVVTLKPRIAHDDHYYDLILLKGETNWTDSYVIDDDSSLNDKDLQVLVKNSVSGAYSSESDVLHFKVDTKAPTFGSSEFSANSSNLLTSIGNFFTYGNFFQETVNAKLTFKDNKSGLDRIYYDLKGGDDWSEKSLPEDGVFSVDIPLGTNNEITFYVTDKAGNESEVIKLLGNADGSLWVIERNDPKLIGTHVENLDGDRISNLTSGNWYNQPVQVVADISESESGIQYADWYVNGASERIIEDSWKKSSETGSVALKYPITKSGVYEVSIDVTDNANNKMGMKELNNIRIDLEAPEIIVDEDAIKGGYTTSMEVPFMATDDVSGIYKVTVVPPLGPVVEATKKSDGNYTFTAGMSGEFTIYARDEAGNESSKKVTIDKISNEVPQNASVVWTPDTPNGLNGWYNTFPVATITPATQKGSTPVTTYYRLWTGDEPSQATGIKEATDVKITSDGIWNLRVWTETDAGIKSDGEYFGTVYVDTTKPDTGVSKVVAETSSQTVTFVMTDNMSGIDTGRIAVNNGSQAIESTVAANADGTGYTGSFVVSNPGEYTVTVYDIAGNVSTQATYKPMTMKVNTIKSITENSAVISNNVYRGTYAISALKYEYKKASDKNYSEITPYAVKDSDGNMTGSYTFSSLEPSTKYNYRMTAVSAAGEVLTYTGSFKTAGATGISITGVAIDADNSSSDITVSLLSGNTVLDTADIKSGEKFTFANVPDGNYNISATNGTTSRTISVNVNNKKVIDPKGDILITLRKGMATSVNLVGSKTPNVSVSGLEDIFSYDTVNFTEDDKKFIEQGGTVEFRLNVAYRAASAVSQTDLAAVYNVIDKNEKVNMFIDLDLYKIRTYASGAVESKVQVHELSGGVSIKVVLPLPSKVAKADEKSVFRVHNSSASQLKDIDKSSVSYTIKSSKFSTYALVYATSGEEKDDTTEATTEAKEKDKTKKDKTTTEEGKKSDTKEVADASGGTRRGGGTTIRNYDSSPKTGDEAPVAAVAVTMIVSMLGIILLKKKETK